ncbi:MAG: hypothetical protein IKN50_01565 [Clostridia bacterium]|nr:hypothetical protein [Clostridia bacterium]
MASELTTVFEESVDIEQAAFISEEIGRQTTLIEIFTIAAAVLIVAAVAFIIFQVKRKNRGRR